MTSLEQLLQRYPQAPATESNSRGAASSFLQPQSAPIHLAARRRSTSSTQHALLSGSIPVPVASSMSAYHQRRTRDFLSRGRHSSSSSSSDEHDDDADTAVSGTSLFVLLSLSTYLPIACDGDSTRHSRSTPVLLPLLLVCARVVTVAGAPQSASYFRPRTFEDYTRYFECVMLVSCSLVSDCAGD